MNLYETVKAAVPLREAAYTLIPLEARRLAVAAPMPLLPPVTNATFTLSILTQIYSISP